MAKRTDEREYEDDYAAQPYQVSSDGEERYDEAPEDFDEFSELSQPYPPYDEYEDEEEDDEQHSAQRFHMAMGVFNFISVLVGVVVILLMVALLISLFSWLKGDVLDQFKLLTQGLS